MGELTDAAGTLARRLAGAPVEDIIAAVAASADPEIVGAELLALAEADPDGARAVLSTDTGRANLTLLAGASRSIMRWLRTHPSELVDLASELVLAPLPDRDALVAEATATVTAAAVPEAALRTFRQSWYMRIALRDLTGIGTLANVGRSLSDLADACLEAALVLATDANPDGLCLIAMGKHGGRELNYSSDVDVLFVAADGDDPTPACRRLLATMATPTRDGIVWRTDADLRPEGRSGKLVRSVAGYVSYWERWADTWEFQALIKARPCAGSKEVGLSFSTAAARFVWPETLRPDALDELRAMKARAEDQVARGGGADRQVKLGPGGIRDVEFAVQLLQLVHGRHDRGIRSPNTITALGELANAGYIAHTDAEVLANSYIKLRTVEHRLQLIDEKQVHTLPTDAATLERIARVLGFRPTAEQSASELFLEEFRLDLATVRSVHERLFYRPLLEAFAGQGAPSISADAAEERLQAFGFADSKATRRALTALTSGMSRQSRLMEATLPLVLGWLTDAPNPDLGLLMLERITEGAHRAEALTAVFRESTLAAQRLCMVIGTSRPLGEAFERFPELIRMLQDDVLTQPRSPEELLEAATRQMAWRQGDAGRLRAIRRFVQRERARTGIRELLGLVPHTEVGEELTRLAEACLQAALSESGVAGRLPPIALIGMGRLGGRELSYGSDLDLMVVHAGGPEEFKQAEAVVQALVHAVSGRTVDAIAFDVDLDLRPEGRSGVLSRTVDGYRQYWERWADTWEFQALLRARPVAGDADLGAELCDAALEHVYREPFPPAWRTDVRKMKARVDKERLPKGSDAALNLKLGRGGIVDVEFAVQLLQLEHGAALPEVRSASTGDAIARLRDAGILDAEAAGRLASAYQFASRIRDRLWLMAAKSTDALPSDHRDLGRLALSLGYTRHPAPTLREDWRRIARRAHAVAEAILYPEDGDVGT